MIILSYHLLNKEDGMCHNRKKIITEIQYNTFQITVRLLNLLGNVDFKFFL